MKVLLSIKPEFVEEIFKGNKKYEFRKSIFKNEVSSVMVYSTKPEGKIVGEFAIDQVLYEDKDNLWNLTNSYSGISKSFFNTYFSNKDKGYAIKIGDIQLYEKPIDPMKLKTPLKPPQSFRYINEDFFENNNLQLL
ncbi:hypothetical protein [Salsuginibacillus kocurii]|uniref:hypothetical protein n=1 Tax=Salsuginibacillus kocurii TaxID=427078 RepID=UPI00036BDD37|nr:hypothetical protein [Salsuginibacillus kocurii]